MLGRIDQGKIQSVDEAMNILETGVKYADTEKGGIVLFKNNISIHIADDGFIKTIVGNAHVKSTWELIE